MNRPRLFPALLAVLLACPPTTSPAGIVFTESFESPDIAGQPGTDPDGWTTAGHPSYLSLVDIDTGEFTTPYGSQALSCYTQTGAGSWAYAVTTAAILDYALDANADYTLTFHVAAVAGRPRAAYRAELVAVDDGSGTTTVLASASANNDGSTDMSYSDTVTFTPDASHAGLVGQRVAIRLGMDYDYNLNGASYQDKPRFDNVTLDIAAPLGIVSTEPADDGAGVDIPPALQATFNLDLVAGSGNITIRNLTDAVDTPVAVGDPAVTISGKDLFLDSTGLLDWNKSYAVRIDAGALESTTGEVYAGIGDDTTWNFTTAVDDPLFLALQDLRRHLDGTVPLTGPEIATRKQTLDAKKGDFDKEARIIQEAMDIVTIYDSTVGALWLPGSPVQSFDRTTVSDEDINWVVFNVMQYLLDEAYNASVLADPAKRALIDGYFFDSVAEFPGAVSPPASPTTHTATISASFPDEPLTRDVQQWELPARKPTGTYLAPGSIVTVTVPPALVNQGYQVRVGAHSWDHEARNRKPIRRLSRATIAYDLDAPSIDIASPYGGGIYIEVPKGALGGVVDVDITGAVRSPYFSVKPFHTTTNAEWIATERNHPGPWADFQTEKFMMQVPTTWIFNLDDPATLMAEWDGAMDAVNDLMGFPRIRGKEALYIQPDVILRSSVHAPGYPAVNQTYTYNPNTTYSGNHGNYMVQGPESGASTEFHEMGHAYRFPKFGGETEANVNLLYVPVLNLVFGKSLDESFRASTGFSGANVDPLDKTAVMWMTSFNFAPREQPMGSWEKSYQPQGHAKWVDVARLFGWGPLNAYWASYMQDEMTGALPPSPTSTDNLLIRLCRESGEDLRPLFHFWGIHPNDPATLAAQVAAEGLTPSPEIYNLLQHYRTLVPADNAAYQAFCQDWYNRTPSINGYGVEREKTRQYDSTSYWQAGGWQYSGTAATNPDGTPVVDDGEIYLEASADRIRARVDALVDLYFDDYDAWSALWPAADLADPDADLDNDGLSNRAERLYGLDPTDNHSHQPVTVPLDGSGTLSYTRRDVSRSGAAYAIHYSTDLRQWFEDTGAVQNAGPPDANGVETVQVTLSGTLMTGDELYVRIEASE